MEKLNINFDKEILELIKKNILERYPIIMNRMQIFDSKREFEIDISFYQTEDSFEHTQIMFQDGTDNYKKSYGENLNINYRLEPSFIIELILYLLKSHEAIASFYKTNDEILLSFAINWCEKNLQGISCNRINLNLDFYGCKNKDELMSTYFKQILAYFFDPLKSTPFIQEEISKYSKGMVKNFATNASDDEIRTLFEKMSINDLRNIIYDLNVNNASIFFNAYNEIKKDEEKPKRLELY